MLFKLPEGISKDYPIKIISSAAVMLNGIITKTTYNNPFVFSYEKLNQNYIVRRLSPGYQVLTQLIELVSNNQTWYIERTYKNARACLNMPNSWLLRMLSYA